ncbi:putative ABC transporter permease [Paenibacillus sophorae]|nr:putative ABC transporter permease [Paenibacillus sophorae]
MPDFRKLDIPSERKAGTIIMTGLLSWSREAAHSVPGEYFYYFIVYSILGWFIEGLYNWYSIGTFRKEGLMKGPYKPMYGFAPLLLLALGVTAMPLPLFLAATFVVPSAVEYATGALLKLLFRRRWWDYSGQAYQLGGHICLQFSLYWWGLSVVCLVAVHPLMTRLYSLTADIWSVLLPMAVLGFAADLALTFLIRRREAVLPALGDETGGTY